MIEVAAGLLCNPQGRVLVSQRAAGTHLAGTWEFPGGKLATGESPHQALLRELAEELGIKVLAAQPLITLRHSYPEKTIRLHVFDVMRWQGEPHSREGQAIRWVDDQQLSTLAMPAADAPILKALRLPSQYLLTPECSPGQQTSFLQQLQRSLLAGVGIVQLRQPGMSPHQLRELAQRCHPVCSAAGSRLLINGDPDQIQQYPADGLHLNSAQLNRLASAQVSGRPTARLVSDNQLLGASCHNQQQLQQALQLDCDYVLLGPVKPTRSHTQAKPLGWGAFSALANECNLPVYALGGMQSLDQDQARACGAIGVAGISGFWLGSSGGA